METNSTAAEIIKGYFAEFWKEPVKKEWVCPDIYRTEYHYTEKRIAKEREKHEAAYQRDYDRAMSLYNDMKANVEKVCSVQTGLLTFFAESLRRWIEDVRAKRASLNAVMEGFRRKWDIEREWTFTPDNPAERPTVCKGSLYVRRHDILRGCWECEMKAHRFCEESLEGHLVEANNRYLRQLFDGLAQTEEEKIAFCKEAIRADLAQMKLAAFVMPEEVFSMTVERFAEIVDAMVRVLGGLPDGFERDHEWGIGGHYNGIVSREGKRAKFTSFYAGGWNIQRLHIRYRVTPLV